MIDLPKKGMQIKMEHVSSEKNEVGRPAGISGSTLKIIAMVIMVIDHIGAVILEPMLTQCGLKQAMVSQELQQQFLAQYGMLYMLDMVLRFIGRIAFPIFSFLLVEGFTHTRSRLKYGRNLFIFALVSEIPFDLATKGSFEDVKLIGGVIYPYSQNVFFTLFIGLLCMCGYEFAREHAEEYQKNVHATIFSWVIRLAGIGFPAVLIHSMFTRYYSGLSESLCWSVGLLVPIALYAVVYLRTKNVTAYQLACTDMTILALGGIMANLLHTDYSALGVLTITLIYLYRANRVKGIFAGCLALAIFNQMEITSFFAMIPVKKYNGERGLSMKYFFYAFYPVHLLLLYLIAACLQFWEAVV